MRTVLPAYIEPLNIEPYALACYFCGRGAIIEPHNGIAAALSIAHRENCPAIERIRQHRRSRYVTSTP
jgi:hypothetical protein